MASLRKNIASQNLTFCLVSATTGAGVAGATVSVLVTKDNGAQASGGGTVTNSGSGQYNYAPTQAETNATDVGFMFTATGAIPVNLDFHTDVTDASGNPNVNVAAFSYTGTVTISTLTTSIVGSLSGSVGSVTAGVTVTTNNDKTGYSLTQSFPANFSSFALTAGGAVTVGTNNDKNGYVLTQSFPTNFALLGITGAGKLTEVVTYTGNTPQTGDFFATVIAEAAAVPATNASAAAKLAWLAAMSLNPLKQTATALKLRNNADGTDIGTSTTSDDGTTAIRGKFA